MTRALGPEDVEAIAVRVAEVLEERGLTRPAAPRLLSAKEAAARLGVTEDWVRRHREQLGAVRLGDGPRGRLRFDPGAVEASMNAVSEGGGSAPGGSRSAPGPAPRRRRRGWADGAGFLPVREVEVEALQERTPRRANARGPGP